MIDLRCGDSVRLLATLPAGCVRTCVTSPPYFGLRDYGTGRWEGGDPTCDHKGPLKRTQAGFNERYFGRAFDEDKQGSLHTPYRDVCGKCGARRSDHQIGLEPTPDAYVARLVDVFRAVRRVLADDGTLWLNLGDSYATNPGNGRGGEGSGLTGKVPHRSGVDRSSLGSKQLLGIPWRVAFALQADGWILRSDIIWHKPNPMPESVRDRPTKAHEYLFLLSKSGKPTVWKHRDGRWVRRRPDPDYRWFDRLTKRETACEPEGWREERLPDSDNRRWRRVNLWRAFDYYYDADAVREPANSYGRQHTASVQPPKVIALQESGHHGRGGDLSINYERRHRNRRSVWTVATRPYKGAHFAVFPPKLIEPCILAGSAVGDTVLDPFCGSGTTLAVADQHGRNGIGFDLNPEYLALARRRLASVTPGLALA